MNTDMDWVDLVTRMGHFHDINVALNQGGENSTTYASVNYRSDESSLKGLSMNAVSARLNSEFKKGIVTLGTQSFLKFDRKKMCIRDSANPIANNKILYVYLRYEKH